MDRVGTRPAPSALYERVMSGRIDADVTQWLVEGFRKFDRDDAALPLERCLQLPTATQRRNSERDYWLRAAAELIDQPSPGTRADKVAEQLSSFMTRGPWREWKQSDSPPKSATELQQALFHAARAIGEKEPPQWRQVRRALVKNGDGFDKGSARG